MSDQPARFILSANDLLTGRVVYLTPQGRWSPRFEHALIVPAARPEQVADAIDCDYATEGVIEPLPVQLDQGGDGAATAVPVKMRARIRQRGPTIAFGRQSGSALPEINQ